jgi:hypothetical protein
MRAANPKRPSKAAAAQVRSELRALYSASFIAKNRSPLFRTMLYSASFIAKNRSPLFRTML